MPLVTRERSGGVDVVRLADPPLNLIGSEMIAEMTKAFTAMAANVPRAVVLFCRGAGANVREMASFDEGSGRRFITALHNACRAVRDLDAPVIAAIDGPCLGAHLEVATACDMRVGSASSRYGMPEIKVGIPSVIDAWWIVQVCGIGRASELFFHGEMIDATRAHRIGLLNRVTPDEALESDALAWAETLARYAPSALVQQKRVLRDWTEGAYLEAARRSIERFAHAVRSPQAAEAMNAMLEKRPARF